MNLFRMEYINSSFFLEQKETNIILLLLRFLFSLIEKQNYSYYLKHFTANMFDHPKVIIYLFVYLIMKYIIVEI